MQLGGMYREELVGPGPTDTHGILDSAGIFLSVSPSCLAGYITLSHLFNSLSDLFNSLSDLFDFLSLSLWLTATSASLNYE